MIIEANVLKEYLKNVYIIGGNACAGKSTVSKALAEKYGFTLYKMDEEYGRHRSFADEQHQPEMCYPRDDIYAFFNRPVVEYADSLQKAIKEEVPMVLMDLVCLAKKRPVIADVLFDPDDIEGIFPDERTVFLTSNEELVRQDYFNRPEKRAFYEAIHRYPEPERSFENVINVVNMINQRQQQCISEKNAFTIARYAESSVENTLEQIEKHFRLAKVFIQTKRLIVRSLVEEDFEEFLKLLDMPEYIGWQMQKSRAKEFFDWHLFNYEKIDIVHGYVCLGIFDIESRKLVGQVGLNEHDDLHEPELGYGILPTYRGKGYAKEAASATLEWAKKTFDIPCLVGTAEVTNIASQKVLEYCGFKFIEEKELLVHITQEYHKFKCYRYQF